MNIFRNKGAFSVLFFLFIGCASPVQYRALSFTEDPKNSPHLAEVYILAEGPGLIELREGMQNVGRLKKNYYLHWFQKSGNAEFACAIDTVSRLDVALEAGKTYYLLVEGYRVPPNLKCRFSLLDTLDGVKFLSEFNKAEYKVTSLKQEKGQVVI